MMNLRVAIVDDEQLALNYISGFSLWQEGWCTLCCIAQSGAELLDRLPHTPADVLLMDVSMPGMDGVALSEALARTFPSLRILAISNYDGYDYVRPVMRNGVQDYLLKSRLTETTLKNTLKRIADEIARGQIPSKEREMLRLFLKDGGEWPFPADKAPPVICFLKIRFAENAVTDDDEAVRAHIEDLIEQQDLTVQITANGCLPGFYLLLLRFPDMNSFAALQTKSRSVCASLANGISQVLDCHATAEPGPIISNHSMIPPYVSERIRTAQEQRLVPATGELSLEEMKVILQQLVIGDTDGIKSTLNALLDRMDRMEIRSRLFYGRSLISLALKAANEWEIAVDAPPTGNALFEWMHSLPPIELSERIRTLYAQIAARRRAQLNPGFSQPLQDAISYMEQHYARSPAIAEVAAAVNVSESHLNRLFRKELRTTPGEYLLKLRMDHAKDLLRQGATVKEAAAAVGFAQYSHFLRVFKKHTGYTVKEFARHKM